MEKDVVKLINKAKRMNLNDEDGTKYNLEPLPGLNESELNELEKNILSFYGGSNLNFLNYLDLKSYQREQ